MQILRIFPDESSGFSFKCFEDNSFTLYNPTDRPCEEFIGIEESGVSSPQFISYPNPTTGQFNLRIDGHVEQGVALELTDLLGKVILKETGNKSNYIFDLSKYPKGVYLLKIKNRG